MALSKILPASQDQFAGARNLIINSAMQISQRGQSFTAQGYSLDRWYHQLSGATSTTTQETFALGSEVAGCSKYLKQATSTANNYCGLVYKVEDVKSLPEGKATFSFYAKGTNPAGGSYTVRLDRVSRASPYESDASPLSSTVTLTSSWQRFVYTFDVPSFSGLGTIDNTSHLYISIHQPDGDTSTAAWELNLTGVQLEVGDVTPFEHPRSYGDELLRCYRYFEKGGIVFANQSVISGLYAVTKRATPTMVRTGNIYSASEAGTFGAFDEYSYYAYTGSTYLGGRWTADAELQRMNITSAQYFNDVDGNQFCIIATIDGTEMSVPLDPANRHYAEIQKKVAAGELTIEEAD